MSRRVVWDWTAAVRKSAKLKARSHNVHFDLSVEAIRALYGAQQGRCALSGLQLSLPPANELRAGLTLTRWAEKNFQEGRIPTLERVDTAMSYTPGNVFLSAAMVSATYRSCADLDEYRTLLQNICDKDVEIPSRETILDLTERVL